MPDRYYTATRADAVPGRSTDFLAYRCRECGGRGLAIPKLTDRQLVLSCENCGPVRAADILETVWIRVEPPDGPELVEESDDVVGDGPMGY